MDVLAFCSGQSCTKSILNKESQLTYQKDKDKLKIFL